MFQNMPELADQGTMTEESSTEPSVLWFQDAGGVRCQQNTVMIPLQTEG